MNGRFLCQPTTGIQRYAGEIVAELFDIRDDLVVLAPEGELNRPAGSSNWRVVQFGAHRGHLWEQYSLRAELRKMGSPLLLSLGNTAPIGYRNQVVTHHDISYVRHPEAYSRSFRTMYRIGAPLMMRSARRILTPSAFSRNEIAGHYNIDSDKFSVVPGAAGQKFGPGHNPVSTEKPYLLAVSSMSAHKNFERLLMAFEMFSNRADPAVRLIVAGAGSRAFRDFKVKDSHGRIEFVGRVADPELVELYRGAVAFVFPSLYEGFGIPPLEAQRCGCPVIASEAASIPEVLGESVLYFDPTSVGSISQAMESIVSDANLRGALRARGIRNAERFSWRSSADSVSRMLDSLLSSR